MTKEIEEIWKTIVRFPEYEVSNYGNVRSKDKVVKTTLGHDMRFAGKLLNQKIHKSGYKDVTLYRFKNPKTIRVHRLVAEVFVPNPDNLPQVNHKDENKLNNNASNLEWCTAKYNCNYGNRTEKIISLKRKKVGKVVNEKVIKVYESITKAAEDNNISVALVSKIVNGKYNSKSFQYV